MWTGNWEKWGLGRIEMEGNIDIFCVSGASRRVGDVTFTMIVTTIQMRTRTDVVGYVNCMKLINKS